MKFAVLGSGAWGCTLASCLNHNGFDVLLWGRNKTIINRINKEAKLTIQSKSYQVSAGIQATLNLEVNDIDVLVVALPSHQINYVFQNFSWNLNKPVIVASKGFYNQDCDLIVDGLKKDFDFRCVYALSGPNLAVEMLQGLPAAAVLAGPASHLKALQHAFSSMLFRVYRSNDVKGVGLGGVLKNAYAISAGVSAGLNLGQNALAALVTRNVSEMQQFYSLFAADTCTMMGLSGLGDLLLSSSSEASRNYKYGYLLATDLEKAKLFSQENTVEGIKTIFHLQEFNRKHKLSCPVLDCLLQLIDEKISAHTAIESLMNRDLIQEVKS